MSMTVERQNQVIIALLARSTIGLDKIDSIVTYKKGVKANNFRKAYNALDGSKGIQQIADMIPTSKQNMSQIVQTWEDKGIVYNTGTHTRPQYVGLLNLPTKPKTRSTPRKTIAPAKPRAPKPRSPSHELTSTATQTEPSAQTNDARTPQ
jgi:hypothetical protein